MRYAYNGMVRHAIINKGVSLRFQPIRRNFHFGKREQFLPQVFQGGTDVVNVVVDNEEAVVKAGRFRHNDRRILLVVPCQICCKALHNLWVMILAATPASRFDSNSNTDSST